MTPEAKVKAYLKEQCETRGWECLPLVHPFLRGWFDRTIFIPPHFVALVEVKAEGIRHPKEHLARQKKVFDHFIKRGFPCFTIVGQTGVNAALVCLDKRFA